MMKSAIILCAGSARRFFPQGNEFPKCLLPLCGRQTILDNLLQPLLARGFEIFLGTGCGHPLVQQHLAARAEYSTVRTVYNADYAFTNSIVTLWQMRDLVNDETVLVNGDLATDGVVFDFFEESGEPQLLVKFLPHFNADTYRVHFDAEYSVRRMGKELADDPSPFCAAYTGLARVGHADFFLKEIHQLLSEGTRGTWPSTAFARLLGRLTVRARDIGDMPFFDIDTTAEHAAARAFFEPTAS